MTAHQWTIEIEYGEFICVKCLATKDSKYAALGCGTKAAKTADVAREKALQRQFDDCSVRLAITQGHRLEKRLWPALKAELATIYKRATEAP